MQVVYGDHVEVVCLGMAEFTFWVGDLAVVRMARCRGGVLRGSVLYGKMVLV